MARVWAQSSRKDGELLVLLALADFANDQGESWPSMPVLAHKARLSERQARKVLDKLVQAGEIRRVRSNGGRNRRNRYVILLSENPEIKTLIKEQGLNNPVFHDQKTLSPVTGALNHHRTTNKRGRKTSPSTPGQFSPHEFLELYASCAPNLPQPRQVTNGRVRKIGQRLKTHPSRDFWRDVLTKANKTPFLLGENGRGWRADLDWFVANDENAVKVFEGKYDRATQEKPSVSKYRDFDTERAAQNGN